MDAWAHHANYIEKNRPQVGLRHFRRFFSFLLFSPWRNSKFSELATVGQ